MFPHKPLLALALMVATTTACSSTRSDRAGGVPRAPAGDGPESMVIATVDGAPLTLSDAMSSFLSSHTGHGALVQGEAAVRELAGRTIERQLFFAEAEALGLHEDPEILAAVDDYRQSVAQDIFWKREVDAKVSVSDEEVEAFYAKTEMALSVALIEVEDRELAATLRERVLSGEDFGELAEQYSIDDSASLGGILSFVRRGEMDVALEQPAFDLAQVGDVTPVVRTARGWAFVRLDARTVNTERPPREVIIPTIRTILEDRAEDALREQVTQRVNDAAGVVVHAGLLNRDALLGTDNADAVVAEAAGETLELGPFRELLNPDVVAASSEADVAEAARELAGEWAHKLAMRKQMETSGMLTLPEVDELTRAFHDEQMLSALYERYVYADLEASEEEIRAYYDAHIEDEYTRPMEVHLAYIVVTDEEQAMGVLERLEAGEDFSDLAREMSMDRTSAGHGGRIGWIVQGELLPEVEERAFALEPGTVDGPIMTELGAFIIRVIDREEAIVVPYVQAKRAATRRVYKNLMRQAYDDWAARLLQRADIKLEDAGIRRAAEWFATQGEAPEAPDSPQDHGVGAPGGMAR